MYIQDQIRETVSRYYIAKMDRSTPREMNKTNITSVFLIEDLREKMGSEVLRVGN